MRPREERLSVDCDSAAPVRAIESAAIEQNQGCVSIRAVKVVRPDDPYMEGHFPGLPVFPGVFLIEALRQAVAAALHESHLEGAAFRVLHSARFLAPLLAGDHFTLTAKLGPAAPDGSFDTEATCIRGDGQIAARLRAGFQLRD